jgi:hypothetical protein
MLKHLTSNQQQTKAMSKNYSYLSARPTINFIVFLAWSVLLLICLYPDSALAVTLEEQLDKVNSVATGKFKTIGITAATIGGAIWSIVKGNLKLTGVIIAIGISMSLYLQWIADGMKL